MAPKKQKSGKKKVAKAPSVAQKAAQQTLKHKKEKNSLYRPTIKTYGIGQAIRPKRDLSRFVRWPRYVRIQRQRAVLLKRLKVPPPINQFRFTLKRQIAQNVLKLLEKYHPENRYARRLKLKQEAKARAEGKQIDQSPSKRYLICGINQVTRLIEKKKVQLVIIAHDIDPLEIVLHLPALCRKMGVPYAIVKSKSRLGQVVGRKTVTCLALENVRPEDKNALKTIVEAVRADFNDRVDEIRKQWGGGLLGNKSKHRLDKIEKTRERELQQRLG
ncbi:hypothetical protein ACOME3_010390 [Neoechinorhynchus agilis]